MTLLTESKRLFRSTTINNKYQLKILCPEQRIFCIFGHNKFMNYRTDLIDEMAGTKKIAERLERFGKINSYYYLNQNESTALIDFSEIHAELDKNELKRAFLTALERFVPKNAKTVLICGIGNPDITSDSFGPETVKRTAVTGHLKSFAQKNGIKAVYSVIPDVAGKTGFESFDIIKAAANICKPELILAIDSLVARNSKRLCRTLQLSNRGITAGSGVNSHKNELSEKTVGIPVIAVGMPTVIEIKENNSIPLTVTPLDIDILIKRPAKILAEAINSLLLDNLDTDLLSCE